METATWSTTRTNAGTLATTEKKMKWFADPGYDYGGGAAGTPREVHGFVLRKPSEIRHHLVTEGVVRRVDSRQLIVDRVGLPAPRRAIRGVHRQ